MQVRTTRFGDVEIADDRVITFSKGLLGFTSQTRFCLLEPSVDACFYWLQSIDDPSLAFVVTDPGLFVSDYQVSIRAEQMTDLSLSAVEDAQVLVIVNKVDRLLTGNLQGPLVINSRAKIGEQIVVAEKRWSTRHPLTEVSAPAHAATA